jgi:hypothetical protein
MPTLVAFCKSLFRLTKASLAQVEAELGRRLKIERSSRGAHLEWMLVYACGEKR